MRKREALHPCAAELSRRDSDRFLTTLFAPPERRPSLCGLYLLNYEVARTAEVVSEQFLGLLRLQWWREALEGLTSEDRSEREGIARQHPALGALASAAASGCLMTDRLLVLIETREQDLERSFIPDLEALEAYAEGTSATLTRAAARLLSPAEGPPVESAARHVGIAWALTGLLRSVPFHAAAGRLYLPRDHLAAVGLDPGEVLAGRRSDSLAGVVMRLALRAEEHLAAARTHGRALPSEMLPALLPGSLAAQYLKRLRRADYDPFDPTVGEQAPGRTWRLLRASFFRRL